MRLSTAMMLGDSLRKRDQYRWLSTDGSCGCAIGGAIIAAGEVPCFTVRGAGSGTSHEVLKIWPWMSSVVLSIISLKFAEVCEGKMTFEQLVDYVRSIEPPEPEELAIPAEIHVSEAIPAR